MVDCMRYFGGLELCVCSIHSFNKQSYSRIFGSSTADRHTITVYLLLIPLSLSHITRITIAVRLLTSSVFTVMFTTPVSALAYAMPHPRHAYHDEHGKLVAIEGIQQDRHVEAPHEGVDGVGHGQNDESDQQHQQDEAGVALQLSTPHRPYHAARRGLHEARETGVGADCAGGAGDEEAKLAALLAQPRADGGGEEVESEEACE